MDRQLDDETFEGRRSPSSVVSLLNPLLIISRGEIEHAVIKYNINKDNVRPEEETKERYENDNSNNRKDNIIEDSKDDDYDEEDANCNKIVRFSPMVRVRPTHSLDHYTPCQIQKCWYQEQEIEEIRNECMDTINQYHQKKKKMDTSLENSNDDNMMQQNEDHYITSMMDEIDDLSNEINNINRIDIDHDDYIHNDTDCDGENFCMRGLDILVPNKKKRKMQIRRKSIRMVLFLQGNGVDCGADEETIAEYYNSVTNPCTIAAHIAALNDEINIYHFY